MDIQEVKLNLLQEIQKLKSQLGYLRAGYPRYHTLFGRDSLFSAWQMLKIDPSIARATLRILARYQGKKVDLESEEEPGKILHEYRFNQKKQMELPNWKFPYYGSVDSTPLFVILATEYLKETSDKAFIFAIMDNILSAFDWIENYGDMDADGYVEYKRKNPNGLFHQGWKDGVKDHLGIQPPVAIVEAQGYTYAAYQALILLTKKFGGEITGQTIEVLLRRAQALRRSFNEDFWLEEKEFFALALDKEKRQRRVVTSNPGHLLFSGIVSKERVKPLISRLFKSDLWTPYGIRTHSCLEPDFGWHKHHLGCIWPHDNWMIYKGLKTINSASYAKRIMEGLLRTYKQLGKIPEFYTVVNSRVVDLSVPSSGDVISNPLQAWASAGLLDMLWAF